MKQTLFNNLKNIYGWKTKRKIVVISVDDYGNVRLDSKKARENMDKAGLKVYSRFDAYDTLETRQDLEALYEVLSSVKDKNGRHAVFTPFALSCNINFEAMALNDYQDYIYELLPETYKKLSEKDSKAYEGAWQLWREGIERGLMKPEFHGREHFNLKVFNEKLEKRDNEVLIALKNRSYTSISSSGHSNISYTAAFAFNDENELDSLIDIATDGVDKFNIVYGYSPTHFMAPTANVSDVILKALQEKGINAFDRGLIHSNHLGGGKYSKTFNYTGKRNKNNQLILVRNVVFEPVQTKDSVELALKQVEASFKWNRPAIISSHRVNFCGHIDEKNRNVGLTQLNKLLKEIVKKWPDVEFMGVEELDVLILNT